MATSSTSSGPEKPTAPPMDEPKPSNPSIIQRTWLLLKRMWSKTGLTPVVLTLMLKGALPPTLVLAAYQGNGFAAEFTTFGYICGIMSFISLAFLPRAKFVQSMTASVLFICLGACIGLIQMACAVSAREHTGGAGSAKYNAAASSTAALWLFVTIWLANLVRAYRPQLMIPTIQYCIFTIVMSTYAPTMVDMTAAKFFVRKVLLTFLTGFAMATGVSLFVLPMTSRQVTMGQMAGCFGMLKGIIKTHADYMHNVSKSHAGDQEAILKTSEDAKKLQQLNAAIGVLFGKMRVELGFARKEIALGKLQPQDFSNVFKHFRNILLPGFGLSTFFGIMQNAKEMCAHRAAAMDSTETLAAFRKLEAEEWDEVISMSHEPYMKLTQILVEGLDHICYVLEITKRPKRRKGDEEKVDELRPGDPQFATRLEKALEAFHASRELAIQRWCQKKGVEMPTTFRNDHEANASLERLNSVDIKREENQQQLYLILYLEFLIFSMGKAIVEMVKYADSKVADGTMKRLRLINPGWRRLRKLFLSSFSASDTDNMLPEEHDDGTRIFVGDSLKQKRDPEHLLPETMYQKVTHELRAIPRLLASPESAYAFRVAVATMSLGIIAYLRQTASFFFRERGLWALIMVAISMGAHSGQGLFGFAARLAGTVIAMVGSIVIWYVGYNTSGVKVFLFFLYALGAVCFMIKNPPYMMVGILSSVTCILILGYELQAVKLGHEAVAAGGQPYYPIAILGPMRLLSVVIGLTVAFIWTYFPFPITTHSTLRRDLGTTLYVLANYYSCVHTTIDAKLRFGIRNGGGPESVMARLDKARHKVLSKCVVMIGKLREHIAFTKYEPTFGGQFPKQKYTELTNSITKMFQYLNLIGYSAETFASAAEEESSWLSDFRRFASDTVITSQETTSTLCLVSASVLNGQPLPPYLSVPQPPSVANKLRAIDPEILSLKHVAEPCYAAFAVLEVTSTLLTEEMTHIVRNVRELVGEVDFSFHVVSTSSADSSTIFGEDSKGKDD